MKQALAAIVATFLAASAFLLAVTLVAEAHLGTHCHLETQRCH
jgi:hypothetical protein